MSERIPSAQPVGTGQSRPWGRWTLGLAMLGCMIGGVAGGVWWLWQPQTLPFETVHITGELHHLKRTTLERVVADRLTGGFFSLDLEALQQGVTDLPWVARASVRRLWPDRLELHVVEHRPVARWGGERLVTAGGEVFSPDAAEIPPGLPNLVGPETTTAPEVLARYQAWSALLRALSLALGEVRLDARGAWSLVLSEGLRIELGKVAMDERLTRFLNVLPQINLHAGTPERIDLRYSHGLAVQWRPQATPVSAPEKPKQSKPHAVSRSAPRTSGRT